MSGNSSEMSLPNWNEIMETAFKSAWQRLSLVDISLYLPQIRPSFDLSGIQISLQAELDKSVDLERDIRYHTINLNLLAYNFAVALYQSTSNGNVINPDTISQAKENMKSDSRCDIYPC